MEMVLLARVGEGKIPGPRPFLPFLPSFLPSSPDVLTSLVSSKPSPIVLSCAFFPAHFPPPSSTFFPSTKLTFPPYPHSFIFLPLPFLPTLLTPIYLPPPPIIHLLYLPALPTSLSSLPLSSFNVTARPLFFPSPPIPPSLFYPLFLHYPSSSHHPHLPILLPNHAFYNASLQRVNNI